MMEPTHTPLTVGHMSSAQMDWHTQDIVLEALLTAQKPMDATLTLMKSVLKVSMVPLIAVHN